MYRFLTVVEEKVSILCHWQCECYAIIKYRYLLDALPEACRMYTTPRGNPDIWNSILVYNGTQGSRWRYSKQVNLRAEYVSIDDGSSASELSTIRTAQSLLRYPYQVGKV